MVAKTKQKTQALKLSGPPGRLRLMSSPPEFETIEKIEFVPGRRLSAILKKSKRDPRFKIRTRGNQTKIRLKFAPDVPPGNYTAKIIQDGEPTKVEITVNPVEHVSIDPLQLTLKGKPGDQITLSACITNHGNVPVNIPGSTVIGLYDDDGIETAFASTYRLKAETADGFLTNFVKKLTEGHGGMLKLRIKAGAGTLAANSRQDITIETKLQSQLRPGRNYHGVWSLGPANFAIVVNVDKSGVEK